MGRDGEGLDTRASELPEPGDVTLDVPPQSSMTQARTGVARAARGGTTPAVVEAGSDLFRALQRPVRYRQLGVLGVGGMGEVQACSDEHLGRVVALKVPPQNAPGRYERFIREARVQGQLEHPAIVPVYEVGLDARSQPFFTMRRLRGRTLDVVLADLRADIADTRAHFTPHRLLNEFLRVCQAVAFAHRRGVVHRDIKPSNIFLGDEGEVYLLDWGIAKLTAKTEGPVEPVSVPDSNTAAGAVLGTPGYMAPEQCAGDPTVDARADVYALGATLFELLAWLPLHEGKRVSDLAVSTMRGANVDFAQRAPQRQVAPELESVCRRATELDRDARYRSVGELIADIEAYLSGDRDLQQRLALADAHADAADRLVERLEQDAQNASLRAAALRELASALALYPEHARAAKTLLRLMLAPPRQLPEEVERDLQQRHHRTSRYQASASAITYTLWLGFGPLLFVMGVRDWGTIGPLLGLVAILALASLLYARRTEPSRVGLWSLILLNTLGVIMASRIFGPFVITPALAMASTLMYMQHPGFGLRTVVGLGCLAVALPFGLEYAGLWQSSYVFEGGTVTILPNAVGLPAGWTVVALFSGSVVANILAAYSVGNVRAALRRAERRNLLQTWQLRQLIPHEARLDADAALSDEGSLRPPPPAAP